MAQDIKKGDRLLVRCARPDPVEVTVLELSPSGRFVLLKASQDTARTWRRIEEVKGIIEEVLA